MGQGGYTVDFWRCCWWLFDWLFPLNPRDVTLKTLLENKIHTGKLVIEVEKIELKG